LTGAMEVNPRQPWLTVVQESPATLGRMKTF
jgi:hypothetical protein